MRINDIATCLFPSALFRLFASRKKNLSFQAVHLSLLKSAPSGEKRGGEVKSMPIRLLLETPSFLLYYYLFLLQLVRFFSFISHLISCFIFFITREYTRNLDQCYKRVPQRWIILITVSSDGGKAIVFAIQQYNE